MEYTESQYHSGWNGPLEIILFHIPLKHGHLEPIAEDQDQLGFEYLQGFRLYNLSGQPVPVFDLPHGEKSIF